jgi:hypothetical protein
MLDIVFTNLECWNDHLAHFFNISFEFVNFFMDLNNLIGVVILALKNYKSKYVQHGGGNLAQLMVFAQPHKCGS